MAFHRPQSNPRQCCQYALVIAFILALRPLAAFAADGEVLIDRLVAEVNNRPVRYSDVQKKVKVGPLVAVSEYPAKDGDSPYEKALQDSINFEIIAYQAKELDIEISEGQLDQEINQFLKERGIDKEKLPELLQQEGQTVEGYRADFRRQLLLREFKRRVIFPLVRISEKDVETYFLSTRGTSAASMVELSLKQIILKLDSSSTKNTQEAKEKLADEVYNKLTSGLAFDEAVRVYSEDEQSRTAGGVMPSLRIKDLTPDIRSAVENLEEGQFSKPVKIPPGLRIFQMVSRKVSGGKEFEDKKAKLELELKTQELLNQTNKWLAEQRQKNSVRIIQ